MSETFEEYLNTKRFEHTFELKLTALTTDAIETWVGYMVGDLTRKFGGASMYKGDGTYVMEKGYVEEEPHVHIVVNYDGKLIAPLEVCFHWLLAWFEEEKQECAWVSFDGVPLLLTEKELLELHKYF